MTNESREYLDSDPSVRRLIDRMRRPDETFTWAADGNFIFCGSGNVIRPAVVRLAFIIGLIEIGDRYVVLTEKGKG